MTEDEAVRSVPIRSGPPESDPSLELFGHGWTPSHQPPATVEGYTGRHRAPEDDS